MWSSTGESLRALPFAVESVLTSSRRAGSSRVCLALASTTPERKSVSTSFASDAIRSSVRSTTRYGRALADFDYSPPDESLPRAEVDVSGPSLC
jgi:hypothetical protein